MGVYIPPPNNNDKERDDAKSNSPKKNGTSNPTNPLTSSASSSDSTTIVIPNPKSLIPHNPSVGLIWGPLTPSSDNRPALYSMIGLQFLLGVGCFKFARNQLRHRLVAVPNGPPQSVRGGSIFKSVVFAAVGATVVFGSGLEISRLILPYDPWYEEARHYRKVAIKNGDKPSLWFGAYKYYQPMSFKKWIELLHNWIENVSQELEEPEGFQNLSIELGEKNNVLSVAQTGTKPSLLEKLKSRGKYNEIHAKLKENNDKRFEHMLSNELKDVNELNKAQRLDLILEGKSELVNDGFAKPSITLGNHTIDNDDDFEMVWLNFEPWDELKLETDYDIRLIPRYALPEEEEQDDVISENEIPQEKTIKVV
ncbi:MGR1 [Candida margitis]|uniref:MGR1 n=1 Tax=Candida margitis TaxID=1775924 RepID=UPI002225E488|nr:MGR1 [Candida margitis]KAI5954034.1 MGR1 [Candida margitis]